MEDEDFVVVDRVESKVVNILDEDIVTITIVEPTIVTDEIYSNIVVERAETQIVAAGQQGPAGLSGAGYIYSQASASAYWLINHNLGFNPTVGVFDSGGIEVDAEVQHININQVSVSFSIPLAGTARLV